jgi:2'-phosphotransferase
MAIGLPEHDGVISGMRASSEVVVEINLAKSVLGAEIPMFISNNYVILSEGLGDKGHIPSENFRSIFNPKTHLFFH